MAGGGRGPGLGEGEDEEAAEAEAAANAGAVESRASSPAVGTIDGLHVQRVPLGGDVSAPALAASAWELYEVRRRGAQAGPHPQATTPACTLRAPADRSMHACTLTMCTTACTHASSTVYGRWV